MANFLIQLKDAVGNKLFPKVRATDVSGADTVVSSTSENLITSKAVYNAIQQSGTAPVWGNIQGTLSNQTDLSTALGGKQDSLTAGTGIKINDNVISIDSTAGIAIYDSRIDDADDWLTNGYVKTHNSSEEYESATANLPSVCTGSDRWGVLLYVAENNENKAGLQQYFPIDGTYKGRVFYRSVTGYGPGITPAFGDWNIVPWSAEKQDTLVSGTNIKTINGNSLLGSGNVNVRTYQAFLSTFVVDGTVQQFVDSVFASTGVSAGMAYLGELECSDLPVTPQGQFGNIEATVSIITDDILVIEITTGSDGYTPYMWKYNSALGRWVKWSDVIANPTGTASSSINKISIDGVVYNISGSSSAIPECPTTTDGTFVLRAVVSNGAVTYSWISDTILRTTES